MSTIPPNTLSFTLTHRIVKGERIPVVPPRKVVARVIWMGVDYFAMCLWRQYGRSRGFIPAPSPDTERPANER